MNLDSDTEGRPVVPPVEVGRRGVLTTAFMGVGLLASHAVAFGFAARYLYPVRNDRTQRMFVALVRDLPPGSSTSFRTPRGKTVNILHGRDGTFTALSDVCPHLGCRVHWDTVGNDFVCPCHDGHFDVTGQPTAGPPKDMNAPLIRYEVVVTDNQIFLEVPVTS